VKKTRKPKQGDSFPSLIVGHGEADLSEIMFNPDNWRAHPVVQREGMTEILEKIGIAQTIIVNKRTGRLVDGHMRVELMIEKGMTHGPVTYIDCDEDTERQLLLFFDRIGMYAEGDTEQIERLISESPARGEITAGLLAEMARDYETVGGFNRYEETFYDESMKNVEDVGGELPGVAALKSRPTFPSMLQYNIPPLLPDLLGDIPENIETWGGPKVSHDEPGKNWLYMWRKDTIAGLPMPRTYVGFYVDDWLMEPFWSDHVRFIGKLLNMGVMGVICPNFTVTEEQPEAENIWNTYRSRWVGRYLQEAGIPIVPDVDVGSALSFGYALAGIPENPPCIAFRMQTFDPKNSSAMSWHVNALRQVVQLVRPAKVALYGPDAVPYIVKRAKLNVPAVWMHSRQEVRRSLWQPGGAKRKGKVKEESDGNEAGRK
jgi:hypothetical protein